MLYQLSHQGSLGIRRIVFKLVSPPGLESLAFIIRTSQRHPSNTYMPGRQKGLRGDI